MSNSNITEIAQLKQKFQNLSSTEVILDVRTPAEYQLGHIPGSLNLDIRDPEFLDKAEEILDKSKTYIVHCKSGGRAISANKRLRDAGFATIYSRPGWDEWQRTGGEVGK